MRERGVSVVFEVEEKVPGLRMWLMLLDASVARWRSCVVLAARFWEGDEMKRRCIIADANEELFNMLGAKVLPILRMGFEWSVSEDGGRGGRDSCVCFLECQDFLLMGMLSSGSRCSCSFRDNQFCDACFPVRGTLHARWEEFPGSTSWRSIPVPGS